MPLFLIALFIIHPLLGLAGFFGAAILIGLAFINDRTTSGSAKASTEAAVRSYQFTDSIARHADPAHAMGMDRALAARWREDRDTMMERQAVGADRNANFTSMIRFVRMSMQGVMLGLGAYLVLENAILAASICAANMMFGRALAALTVAVGGWRQIEQAIAAGRRVQKAPISSYSVVV